MPTLTVALCPFAHALGDCSLSSVVPSCGGYRADMASALLELSAQGAGVGRLRRRHPCAGGTEWGPAWATGEVAGSVCEAALWRAPWRGPGACGVGQGGRGPGRGARVAQVWRAALREARASPLRHPSREPAFLLVVVQDPCNGLKGSGFLRKEAH